jgi:environmental stress-induced protein Ves
MIRLIPPEGFRRQPWANGRGETVEMLRIDDGGRHGDRLILRLSRARVAEDGPFSLFPGIDRCLTVIAGPGFRLTGAVALTCAPGVPVTFPGDVAVAAEGTAAGASEDLNVMWARGLPPPRVSFGAVRTGPGVWALLSLAPLTLGGEGVAAGTLALGRGPSQAAGGPAVLIEVPALTRWP